MQLGSTQCRQWGRAPSPVCSQCERAQGSRKRHPGVAGPVLGSPPSPGPVRVWIRSSWSPEKQTQGHGSPLTATGSSWRTELLGGVAVGEEGTVALGALGQDWTQRHLSGGTHPHVSPTRPLWGSQHCRTSHRLLSFGLFCSESDAHLPAGAMCTVTPR